MNPRVQDFINRSAIHLQEDNLQRTGCPPSVTLYMSDGCTVWACGPSSAEAAAALLPPPPSSSSSSSP